MLRLFAALLLMVATVTIGFTDPIADMKQANAKWDAGDQLGAYTLYKQVIISSTDPATIHKAYDTAAKMFRQCKQWLSAIAVLNDGINDKRLDGDYVDRLKGHRAFVYRKWGRFVQNDAWNATHGEDYLAADKKMEEANEHFSTAISGYKELLARTKSQATRETMIREIVDTYREATQHDKCTAFIAECRSNGYLGATATADFRLEMVEKEANCYMAYRKMPEAIAPWNEYISVYPQVVSKLPTKDAKKFSLGLLDAYLNRLKCTFESRRQAEAVAMADDTITKVNESPWHVDEALKVKVRALEELGRLDEAFALLKQWQQFSSKNQDVKLFEYYRLAKSFQKQNEYAKAIAVLSQGREVFKDQFDQASLWYAIGEAYDASGDRAKAVETMQAIVSAMPDSDTAKFARGKIFIYTRVDSSKKDN